MTGCRYCPLTAAIKATLPGIETLSRQETDWHSATFSGVQITLEIAIPAAIPQHDIDGFCATLDEHEFDLRSMFVADIALAARRRDDSGRDILTLQALLLEQ
jgi:hypothetical protein